MATNTHGAGTCPRATIFFPYPGPISVTMAPRRSERKRDTFGRLTAGSERVRKKGGGSLEEDRWGRRHGLGVDEDTSIGGDCGDGGGRNDNAMAGARLMVVECGDD
ncbi:hypothetical protein PIB30_049203 [Stylosanthes scabra]|uniref:Uncharacterized protein n=1 Tax=Stylosanthes scabra TaxID=79078 RepID=A0ABU6XGB3_9FABA|nr:hypothetical protein [Stylosanthes scabra]